MGLNLTKRVGYTADKQLLVTFMNSAVSEKLDQENGPVLFPSKLTILQGDGNMHSLSIPSTTGMSLAISAAQLSNSPLHSEVQAVTTRMLNMMGRHTKNDIIGEIVKDRNDAADPGAVAPLGERWVCAGVDGQEGVEEDAELSREEEARGSCTVNSATP